MDSCLRRNDTVASSHALAFGAPFGRAVFRRQGARKSNPFLSAEMFPFSLRLPHDQFVFWRRNGGFDDAFLRDAF